MRSRISAVLQNASTGAILLQEYATMQGFRYVLPGGNPLPEEAPLTSLRRELLEELSPIEFDEPVPLLTCESESKVERVRHFVFATTYTTPVVELRCGGTKARRLLTVLPKDMPGLVLYPGIQSEIVAYARNPSSWHFRDLGLLHQSYLE